MKDLPCATFEDSQQLDDAIQFLKKLLVKMSGAPNVLVVEDDENDFFILKRLLNKFQCIVSHAKDGEEAVTMIREKRFDVILMDQAMPKLTGNEVLSLTTGWRKDSRVIMVTGYLNNPCMPKALENGAVMAFAKPISEQILKLFLTPI